MPAHCTRRLNWQWRRRARTGDRVVHAAKVANEAGRITARDTVRRAHGVLAGTQRLFRREEVLELNEEVALQHPYTGTELHLEMAGHPIV